MYSTPPHPSILPPHPASSATRRADDTCTGYEFNINNTAKTTDYSLGPFRGNYILKGYFTILGIAGPHQEPMGVSLKPMSMESVAPGLAK